MKTDQFEAIFQHRVGHAQETLVEKAKEYASKTDRLHNFKAQGALNGVSALEACWGNASKHAVSVADMVREEGRGATEYPMSMWDEKLGDLLNYCILTYACVCEQKKVDMTHPTE